MRRTTWIHRTITGLMGMALLAAFTGCSGETTPTASAAQTLSAAEVVPTQADLDDLLGLTDEQSAALNELLAEWRAGHEQRQGQRGQQGRRGQGGPDIQGETGDFQAPVAEFLRGAADILTPDQMVILANHLVEKQEQRREEMRARFEESAGGEGRGPGFGRHGGGRGQGSGHGGGGERGAFLEELDLTEEQRTQLREAMGTMREATRNLMQGYRNDEIDEEALRDGLKALEANRTAVMQGILTEDQFQAWEEHRLEKQQEMAERRLERLGEGEERKVAFLTDVLHLDESQVTALQAVIDDGRSQVEALLQSFAAGDLDRAYLGYEMSQLREAGRTAIVGFLNEDQVAVFEAIEPLAPGGRKHHRHGR